MISSSKRKFESTWYCCILSIPKDSPLVQNTFIGFQLQKARLLTFKAWYNRLWSPFLALCLIIFHIHLFYLLFFKLFSLLTLKCTSKPLCMLLTMLVILSPTSVYLNFSYPLESKSIPLNVLIYFLLFNLAKIPLFYECPQQND